MSREENHYESDQAEAERDLESITQFALQLIDLAATGPVLEGWAAPSKKDVALMVARVKEAITDCYHDTVIGLRETIGEHAAAEHRAFVADNRPTVL